MARLLTKYSMMALAMLGCQLANAAEIFLPESTIEVDHIERLGSIELPTAQYGVVTKPSVLATGNITRRAWTIDDVPEVFAFYEAVRDSIANQGYEIVYECATRSCGGFDFRYGIETSPPPDFQVNLDEFYYADLRENGEITTLLVSGVDGVTHVQVIEVTPSEGDVPALQPVAQTVAKPEPVAVEAQPASDERLVLAVSFASGSSQIESIDEDQLASIANTLAEAPDLTAYLVGHSDQTGSLAANRSITLARAQSVRTKLIEEHGVDAGRLIADGVGFLAPIATNTTEEGRALNRRVEIVYLAN